MERKIWNVFPQLTEQVWADHRDAGMLGGHHDPDHVMRVGQMALEFGGEVGGASGLVHNADRILQKRLGIGRRDVPEGAIRDLVLSQLRAQPHEFREKEDELIVDAVLGHNRENRDDDSPVLVALMDADRLVNAKNLVIRSAQNYFDLPPIDPVFFDKDPTANYRDPKSVLRDIMETLEWLTPGTPFYVRLPKAREMAVERREFFEDYVERIIRRRAAMGFHPYPPELIALREKFAPTTPTTK